MLRTFLSILPFALAAAISPMLLAEQTLLLSTQGRPAGRRFGLGVTFVLIVIVALLIAFGRAISLPKEPKLSSGLDIVIGVGLLLIAHGLWWRKRHDKEEPEKQESSLPRFGASGAYAFGMFSMATNFTSLALIVPATKEISASDTTFPERELLALVLVFIVATPVWLPLALTAIAPGPAERFLEAVDQFIKNRGRKATLILLVALGAFLVLRGVIHVI